MTKKNANEFEDNDFDGRDDLGILALFERAREESEAKNLLDLYLRDLGQCEPISGEEAEELADRYKSDHDLEALHRLTEACQRLVYREAKRFRNTADPKFLDIVQAGNEGLMRSARNFDSARGTKFSTYAVSGIRGYILNHVRDDGSLVKIGTTENKRKILFNLNKVTRALEARGIEPTPKVIADILNVKESEVEEVIIRMSHPDLSLDAPLGDGSDEDGMSRRPAEAPSVEDAVDALLLRARLRSVIAGVKDTLNDKERFILEKRLYSDEPMTQQAIADVFGITRERARQIEENLQKKLRREVDNIMPDIKVIFEGEGKAPAKSGRRVNSR